MYFSSAAQKLFYTEVKAFIDANPPAPGTPWYITKEAVVARFLPPMTPKVRRALAYAVCKVPKDQPDDVVDLYLRTSYECYTTGILASRAREATSC